MSLYTQNAYGFYDKYSTILRLFGIGSYTVNKVSHSKIFVHDLTSSHNWLINKFTTIQPFSYISASNFFKE